METVALSVHNQGRFGFKGNTGNLQHSQLWAVFPDGYRACLGDIQGQHVDYKTEAWALPAAGEPDCIHAEVLAVDTNGEINDKPIFSSDFIITPRT